MNSSSQEGKGKKKMNEVKIFPVPFALGEIKTNLSINTNSPSKPSKEQIINQAWKFHSQGKISEARKYYQLFINQGGKDHRVFSNYGVILKNNGNLQEAESSYRKAIELNPDFADAYSNLGIILKDIGKLQDAFDSYLKVIQINPSFSNIYPSITRFLRDSDPSQLNKLNLKKILNLLLERNDVPHQELFNAFYFVYRNEIIISLEKLDSDFSGTDLLINKKIIINALKKITCKDIRLEKLLTNLR